jgi:hypothetical protein
MFADILKHRNQLWVYGVERILAGALNYGYNLAVFGEVLLFKFITHD